VAGPAAPRLAAAGRPARRADGVTEPLPLSARLAEERRLFYVATTRASRRLVVTAVDSPEDDGVRPSRFVAELGVTPRVVGDRPAAGDDVARAGRRAAFGRRRSAPARAAAPQAAAGRLATLASAREGTAMLVALGPSRPVVGRGRGVPSRRTSCIPRTGRSRCPDPR
jgi:hypothetical protein